MGSEVYPEQILYRKYVIGFLHNSNYINKYSDVFVDLTLPFNAVACDTLVQKVERIGVKTTALYYASLKVM